MQSNSRKTLFELPKALILTCGLIYPLFLNQRNVIRKSNGLIVYQQNFLGKGWWMGGGGGVAAKDA